MADVNQLFQKANLLSQKGRYKDAIKVYQKVVRQAPSFYDGVNMYAIALAQSGNLAAAAEQFSRLIKLNANKPEAYENLGRVYMQSQQFSQAQQVYEAAVKLFPRAYALHFGLGGAYMSQNLFEPALAAFNQAKSLNASQPVLFINLGTVLSQLGNVDEAAQAFNKAVALDPNNAHALLRLGQLYIEHHHYLQAEQALEKANQLLPDNFDILLSLADACQHNDKKALAVQYYLQADSLQPGSQNIYTKLDKLFLYSEAEEKVALLDRISEEHVYTNWQQPLDDARQLAALTSYHDKAALNALNAFFDDYQPRVLHEREWWQEQLATFGDKKAGHDKILRGIHSAVFSWSLPDRETLATLADFIADTSLYSYGAGSAFWERLLSEHFNITVTATDFSPRHSYLPITPEDYSKSTIPADDTIFLAWIIRGDTGVMNILRQMQRGQKLILTGEPPDAAGIPRICATPEMFAYLDEAFTLEQSIPLVNYSMLNDTTSLYIKK